MGAWGVKPWENDVAADWFSLCMKEVNTEFILDEAESILEKEDEDELRAISYLIGHLGKVNIWPSDMMDRVDRVKERLAQSLIKMLDTDSDFLDLWDNDDIVVQELKKEIKLLKE